MSVYFSARKMSVSQLANPFSSATVVLSDDYVDTFPHPQGLITYLHRLCIQLDVDIVSLERPVIVKGSWKTIIRIDAFLKTLISTLHSAISKGAVPSEADFSAAFTHFEEESSYHTESLENKHTTQNVVVSNDLSELKTDDYFDIIKVDEDNGDQTILDKWYFNSNPRGKTVDKRRRRYSNSGKMPPEPYVIVEANDTNKRHTANLIEIEHVLSQVYKKETIEKYQKKSCVNDKQMDELNISLQGIMDIVSDDEEQQPVSEHFEELISPERNVNTVSENSNSHSLRCMKNSLLDSELESSEPKSEASKETRTNSLCKTSPKVTHDKYYGPSNPRMTTRQRKNSEKNRTIEFNDKTLAAHKRQKKKHRRCNRKKENDRKFTEKLPQKTSNKDSKLDASLRKTHEKGNPQAVRHNKTNTENVSYQANQKLTRSVTKLEKEEINKIDKNHISSSESNIKSKTGLKMSKPGEKGNNKTRNHQQRDVLDSQYHCDKCSYLTTKPFQLLEHKRRVHLTKKFRCEECLKEFGFRKDLRRHMKCHTKAENCCDICGKMYKEVRKLTEHKRVHADDYKKPEFPCKFCTKTFSTKYVLAYHIKSDHLGMKLSYICPTCGKSFSQKNSYLQHANVHLGIKPFTCDVCGKRFSYEKSLKEHKFMHNEDKVFTCAMCNKSFRQASGLAIHIKVHKTTKDYVCSMCGKGFSQKQALVRHERIHAGEKPYECGLCKRTFADSSVLRRHMILIHKKDPKQWRHDTLYHVPKRTDFFISVLNGEGSHSKDSEIKRSDNVYLQKQHSHQEIDHCEQEPQKQTPYEQGDQLRHPVETGDSVSVTFIKSDFVDLSEPVTTAGNFMDSSCSDIKPHVQYVSNKASRPDLISSIVAASNHHLETALLPSNIHSTACLPLHGSTDVPTHNLRSITHQHQTPLATHPMQSQPIPPQNPSFVPVGYQHRPVNYGAGNTQPIEMQPVQYSAMVTQPYTQSIVVFQDGLGTITYHQPVVNVAFSGQNGAQDVHLQHVSPSVSLPSSPLTHVTDISQAVTSVPAGHIYDQMVPTGHQHPQ